MKVNIRNFNKGPTERQIDIKVEKWDTYSLDHTLALIILPTLLQLKQSKNGVPSEFISGVGSDLDSQYCFDFISEDSDRVFNECVSKWDEALDKMIWSFQQLVMDDYDNQYHHGKMDIAWEKSPEPINHPVTGKPERMYQMVDKNPGGHWYDVVGHTLHEERIQEGLELFGKHYRSLWD